MFFSICRHTNTHTCTQTNRAAERPSHSIEFVLKIIALFLFQYCVTAYKHMHTNKIMHVMPHAIVNKTSFRCSKLSRYVFRSNKIALIRCRMIFSIGYFANVVNIFTQNESFPSLHTKQMIFFIVCRFDEKQKKNFYSKTTHKHNN